MTATAWIAAERTAVSKCRKPGVPRVAAWVGVGLCLLAGYGWPPGAWGRAPSADVQRPLPGIAQHWPLPRLLLPMVGGGHRILAKPGQLTLINYWATWCPACVYEIPELVRLERRHPGIPVHIVGIALDSGSADQIRAFAHQHAMAYPLLMARNAELSPRLRVVSLPTTLIVDQNGVVRRRIVGPQSLTEFRAALSAVAGTRGN